MKKNLLILLSIAILGLLTPIFARADTSSLLFPSFAISPDNIGNVSVALTGDACTSDYYGISSMNLYKGTYPDTSQGSYSRYRDYGGSPIQGNPLCVWNSVFTMSSAGDGTTTYPNYPYGVATYTYTDGDYWLKFTFEWNNTTSNTYYVPMHYNLTANLWTLSSSDTGHIMIMSLPTPNASTSSPISFQGTYYNSSNYTEICAIITGQDGYNGSQCHELGLVVGSNLPYSFTATLPNNQTYTYYLQLNDIDFGYHSDHSASVSFMVGAGSSISSGGYTPQACSWLDFSTWGGCISNIIYTMFNPSQASIQQFNSLYTTYRTKPPFGYINAIQLTLATVNDTGTSIFSLQSMPILNTYIFTPLKIAFTWILWVGFAFLLFKRFKDIQL